MASNPLKCQNGHPVNQLKLKEAFYRGRTGLTVKKCAVCDKELNRKEPRWRCDEHCHYYCCQNCYDKSVLPSLHDAHRETLDEPQANKYLETQQDSNSILPLLAQIAGQEVDSDGEHDDGQDAQNAGMCGPCKACVIGYLAACFPGLVAKDPARSLVANDYEELKQQGEAGEDDFLSSSAPLAGVMGDQSTILVPGDLSPVTNAPSQQSVDTPKITRTQTTALFRSAESAPSIGGLSVSQSHSPHLLPPEAVLFEPAEGEMFMHGKRLIYLNTRLDEKEQKALKDLHDFLAEECQVTEKGEAAFPLYVRQHALRILVQAKFDTKKAVQVILTHMNMRVKWLPLSEDQVLSDLRRGLMYWHGRDRKCRPCLVWTLNRMEEFNKDRAVKLALFVLEYAIRFALVPGRVENWILIVDLDGVGMGHASSSGRDIAKNVGLLLEQVYCGRNFCTKIINLPWVVRSIVNSMIPADKKEKVQFLGSKECPKVMMELFEPHQLEKKYGGSAPDLAPDQTYPFRFFPNASGPNKEADKQSLHMYTDRAFHEGVLWDESSDAAKAKWSESVQKQSLTAAAVRDLKTMGIDNAKACNDIKTWMEVVNPEEARRMAGADSMAVSTSSQGVKTASTIPSNS